MRFVRMILGVDLSGMGTDEWTMDNVEFVLGVSLSVSFVVLKAGWKTISASDSLSASDGWTYRKYRPILKFPCRGTRGLCLWLS